MTKLVKSLLLAISFLVVIIAVGCSSSLNTHEAPGITKEAAFSEIKVMMFQPPT